MTARLLRNSCAAAICAISSLALAAGLPPGFVRLRDVAPQIRQEMRYAGRTISSAARSKATRPAIAGHGFDNYRKEWWHFTFATDRAPPSYDLPITND